MVVINHCTPDQLTAYSTVPLTLDVTASVHQDFAIGSFARFDDPLVTISIHDRPDFHNASHYQIRETLDREGFLDEFLLLDDRTASTHAIWYIETTETSRYYTADAIRDHNPPIEYEGEDFVLWQGRFLTQDFPIQWEIFFSGGRDLIDDIQPYISPYDPHNPQVQPFTLGLKFSSKEDGEGFLGDAYLEAEFDEVEWSTDIKLRRLIVPPSSVMIRLTEKAAREAGLLSQWSQGDHVPRPGETVTMFAPYDWDSPKWSLNQTSDFNKSLRSLSLDSPTADASGGTCRSKNLLRLSGAGFHNLSSTRGNNALLFKNKANASRTLSEVS